MAVNRWIVVVCCMLPIGGTLQSAESFFPRTSLERDLEKMEDAIDDYRDLAERDWPAIAYHDKLELGMRGSNVALIRERLSVLGDARSSYSADPELFDEVLQMAVQRFQARHGLEADGTIGRKTLAAMNVSPRERYAQLKVALERMQAFVQKESLGESFILVNIPGASLTGYEEGMPALHMKAIVGRPDRPTPLFDTVMTSVQMNPEWHVPGKIAAKDLLPKVQKNPEYLEKAGFTVMIDGVPVNHDEIDWQTVEEGDFPFTLKQRAGDDNALGKVKFSIVNDKAIYLHSTSNPELFAKAERHLSSGCVRVEEPKELMRFVLRDRSKVAPERVDALYEDEDSQSIVLTQKLPVHIVYWTAGVSEELDQPYFYPDVYKHDAAKIQAAMRGEMKVASR